MNKVVIFICYLIYLLPIHAGTDKVVDVYYILPNVTDEELRDINIVSSYIGETLKKDYITGVNIIYSKNVQKNLQSYMRGDDFMLGQHMLNLAQNYSLFEPITKYYFIFSLDKNLFEEYIVLAKSVSSVKNIRGLKGVTDGSQNADIFSDMICFDNFKKESKKVLSIKKAKNAQEAIFKVYFDQSDIAFVPLRSWKSALSLNPSLEKNLKIISISPKVFTYGVLSVRNNMPNENLNMLKQVSTDMLYKSESQKLKIISKIKSNKLLNTSELKPVITYYLKYLNYKENP